MTETTITTPSWVQALDKYVASKPIEDVAADLGLKPEEIIMLVANENPNGMSSKVKEAVATAALNLNRMPTPIIFRKPSQKNTACRRIGL